MRAAGAVEDQESAWHVAHGNPQGRLAGAGRGTSRIVGAGLQAATARGSGAGALRCASMSHGPHGSPTPP